MSNILAKVDVFGIKHVDRLHFNELKVHKTAFGGLCTIILGVMFVLITFVQGYPIYKKFGPKFSTKNKPDNTSIPLLLNGTDSFLHFTIWDGVKYFEIDETKIDIRVHVMDESSEPINGGSVKRLRRCTKDDFGALFAAPRMQAKYCIENDDQMALRGTIQSYLKQETIRVVSVHVKRCTGPGCSPDHEIDQWLKSKSLMVGKLESLLDYHNYQNPFSKDSQYLVSLKMDNHFSDTGFLLSPNQFNAYDSYLGR